MRMRSVGRGKTQIKKVNIKTGSKSSLERNVRSQHTGAVLSVREIGWRGTSTDKVIVDEFLDLEYKDIEEASPASMFLKNGLSSYAPSVGDDDVDVVVSA